MQLFILLPEKKFIVVLPQLKQYYRFELNQKILSTIEYLDPANPNGIMSEFGTEKCTRLDRKEIKGQIVEGFEVKDIKIDSLAPRFLLQLEDIDLRIWVDNETLLPVEIELETEAKGLLTGYKDFIGRDSVYDIEYGVEFDESIFKPNIPEDYKKFEPAKAVQKAEITMWCVLPFCAVMFKRKKV